MNNFVPYFTSQEYALSLNYSKKQTMSLIKVSLIKQTGCIYAQPEKFMTSLCREMQCMLDETVLSSRTIIVDYNAMKCYEILSPYKSDL